MLGLLVLAVMALVVLDLPRRQQPGRRRRGDLATAQARGQRRSRPRSPSYAEVPQVLAEVDAAQANLVTAMTPEIRWSFYLNDLSLTIPQVHPAVHA